MFLIFLALIGGAHYVAHDVGHPLNCNTNPIQAVCEYKTND